MKNKKDSLASEESMELCIESLRPPLQHDLFNQGMPHQKCLILLPQVSFEPLIQCGLNSLCIQVDSWEVLVPSLQPWRLLIKSMLLKYILLFQVNKSQLSPLNFPEAYPKQQGFHFEQQEVHLIFCACTRTFFHFLLKQNGRTMVAKIHCSSQIHEEFIKDSSRRSYIQWCPI